MFNTIPRVVHAPALCWVLSLTGVLIALLMCAPSAGAVFIPISADEVVNTWTSHEGPISKLTLDVVQVVDPTTVQLDETVSKISPYALTGNFDFTFDFRIDNPTDADAIGAFIAWQDEDNYIRFTWDGFHETIPSPVFGLGDSLGTNGIVNILGTDYLNDVGDPVVHGVRVLKVVGGVNTYLYQDLLGSVRGWEYNVDYNLIIGSDGGDVHVVLERLSDNFLFLDTLLPVGMSTDGKIGIFADSQARTFVTDISVTTPEPTGLMIAALGALGSMFVARRRRNSRRVIHLFDEI